jgi:predicted RNA binding protein YcfA (HicA-like mRNA interferase family)
VAVPRIPGVNHLDAVRALEKVGFRIIRQGKHIVMSDGTRQVTIPRHNPLKAFTMGGIAQDAGLTPEEFRKLL